MHSVTMRQISNSRIESARNQAEAHRQARQAQPSKRNFVQRFTGLISGLLAYALTGVKPGHPVSQNRPI